jgi:predicted MFS family arabinose efflux permease
VVAGKVVANLSVSFGWQGVFKMLAVVALLTSLVAAFFLADQLRPTKSTHTPLMVDAKSVGAEVKGGDLLDDDC